LTHRVLSDGVRLQATNPLHVARGVTRTPFAPPPTCVAPWYSAPPCAVSEHRAPHTDTTSFPLLASGKQSPRPARQEPEEETCTGGPQDLVRRRSQHGPRGIRSPRVGSRSFRWRVDPKDPRPHASATSVVELRLCLDARQAEGPEAEAMTTTAGGGRITLPCGASRNRRAGPTSSNAGTPRRTHPPCVKQSRDAWLVGPRKRRGPLVIRS
jgi:hypothetical protein